MRQIDEGEKWRTDKMFQIFHVIAILSSQSHILRFWDEAKGRDNSEIEWRENIRKTSSQLIIDSNLIIDLQIVISPSHFRHHTKHIIRRKSFLNGLFSSPSRSQLPKKKTVDNRREKATILNILLIKMFGIINWGGKLSWDSSKQFSPIWTKRNFLFTCNFFIINPKWFFPGKSCEGVSIEINSLRFLRLNSTKIRRYIWQMECEKKIRMSGKILIIVNYSILIIFKWKQTWDFFSLHSNLTDSNTSFLSDFFCHSYTIF